MSRNVGTQIGPAHGLNGTYSTHVFTEEAVKIIQNHHRAAAGNIKGGSEKRGSSGDSNKREGSSGGGGSSVSGGEGGVGTKEHDTGEAAVEGAPPLYMYVAPQNVHLACGNKASKLVQGIQAPCETVRRYDTTVANDTYKGQSAVTTELDYLVGNITAALKAVPGMWENTIVVFTSDNGGPLDHTTNAPLRGGKHTFWDGGVRVVAGVGGGLIPAGRRGSTWGGLAHSADWYRTLVEGVAGAAPFGRNGTGPVPDDSVNLWPAIVEEVSVSGRALGAASPRTEVIHQVRSAVWARCVFERGGDTRKESEKGSYKGSRRG